MFIQDLVEWLRGARSHRSVLRAGASGGSLWRALGGSMRDSSGQEPPLPPPSPRPASSSRLRRTLHSLRSPFRAASPFHLGSLARSPSAASSASDGDLARDERTMRKRNKKTRDLPASDASRSTDSSPSVDKKKEGFIRRMGSIGKKRGEGSSSTPPSQHDTKESTIDTPTPPPGSQESVSTTPETASPKPPTPELPTPEPPTPEPSTPEASASEPENAKPPAAEPSLASTSDLPNPAQRSEQIVLEPVSPIAVERLVATRLFSKSAWKKHSEPSMDRPVEDPSPESALRRRIAFVAQASACFSEDHEDEGWGQRGAGHEVGSLEEAVALARVRLAPAQATAPHERGNDTEEEGYADTMPAYGDLIEPVKPGNDPSQGSSERREHLYKILVIGELGTGKTSIIKRYVHQFFSQHYRATIGVDFALKVLNWDANTIIRLQLWDIAGQERFGNMTRVYYKEAVGAFIVFDVSRLATFDAVVKWKTDLDNKVQLPDGSAIPCILLANKCDQQKEGIVNSPTKMEEYCREKGFAGWFETSAKENINIEEAARSLVNKILLNDKLLQSSDKDGERFALEHKIANGENSGESSKNCNC